MAASASNKSKPTVLGCGDVSLHYLATVASFPNPDDKVQSLTLKVEGGGNTGNALTGAARLGLSPRIISKVAEDGNSSFTYVIVDNQTKTRTCINTPGSPPMIPEELTKTNLSAALDDADIIYFDVRLHDTALLVAEEGRQRKIPILIDAERKREGLDELLKFASYVVCAAKFPKAWTGASSTPIALVSMLLSLPNVKFVIVTLGEKGCLMLERSRTGEFAIALNANLNEAFKTRPGVCTLLAKYRVVVLNLLVREYLVSRSQLADASETAETDVESLVESLEQKLDMTSSMPKCIASKSNLRISADGVGFMSSRLLLGTAEVIPTEELVDTTGAGDAFVGAVLYGLCTGMPSEKMLPFAAQVAGCSCRALGARNGLPHRTDPRLAGY